MSRIKSIRYILSILLLFVAAVSVYFSAPSPIIKIWGSILLSPMKSIPSRSGIPLLDGLGVCILPRRSTWSAIRPQAALNISTDMKPAPSKVPRKGSWLMENQSAGASSPFRKRILTSPSTQLKRQNLIPQSKNHLLYRGRSRLVLSSGLDPRKYCDPQKKDANHWIKNSQKHAI